MDKGNRKAVHAVVTLEVTVEAKALPQGTSAQKAELIALIRALELLQEKRVNVHTDSRYAFLILHVHGLVWKERGLLTCNKREIKQAADILKLLEAVQVPYRWQLCTAQGIRKRTPKWLKETIWLIKQQKKSAKGTFTMPFVPVLDLSQFDPEYLTADLEKAKSWG